MQGRFLAISNSQLAQLKSIIESPPYNGQINNETFIQICQQILQSSKPDEIVLDSNIKSNGNVKLSDNTVTQRKQWKGKDALE